MPLENIRQVNWQEVHRRVSNVNSTVAAAIDAIPHHEHPNLYLASYSFGELIIDHGLMRIPALPDQFADDIRYSNIPLFITLNKSTELFLDLNSNSTYPLHLFFPGKTLGIWSILDAGHLQNSNQPGIWSLAAGARTIFMLPKVMDYGSHSKMQRQLQLSEAYPPHNLFDQGLVFTDIAASKKIRCTWQQDILIFGKGWAEGLQTGKWPELHHTLLQQEWNESLFLRNHMNTEILWQFLAQAQAQTRIKPSIYVIDTVKHLINIALNASVGFAPLANEDETIAPVSIIQNAYLEYYHLKQYIPTLLAPAYLKNSGAVYYSFLYPTLLSLSPNYNFRNTLEDERNIRHILTLVQNMLSQYPNYQHPLSPDIQFDFFHYEADPIYNIHPVQDLPKNDPLLDYYPANPDLIFSETGPFLRACVKIQNPSSIR